MVGLATAGVSAGLALGASACGVCRCPTLEPFTGGTFTVVEAPGRAELEDAVVAVDDEAVEISFTRGDGSTWVIAYDVVTPR